MNPILRSALTSALMSLCAGIATRAATIGVIPGAEKDSFANILAQIVLWLGAVALGALKAKMQTKASMIASLGQKTMIANLNARDNGVSVVSTKDAQKAGISQVSAPLK